MSASDPTYVIFDGDKDMWAYAYMKGWDTLLTVEFNFRDAHDLDTMTSRAQGEQYVKSQLRKRMERSSQVIVLVGESTKNLHRFVTWEIDLALELNLPIIVVNLNNDRHMDDDRCPVALRKACAVHIPFKRAIIKYALDDWPGEYYSLDEETRQKGARIYNKKVYDELGL